MSTIRPQLVTNEQGQVCMQLRLGHNTATLPLPERLAGASNEKLQEFFNIVVPEMTENLRKMHRQDQRKFNRRISK